MQRRFSPLCFKRVRRIGPWYTAAAKAPFHVSSTKTTRQLPIPATTFNFPPVFMLCFFALGRVEPDCQSPARLRKCPHTCVHGCAVCDDLVRWRPFEIVVAARRV